MPSLAAVAVRLNPLSCRALTKMLRSCSSSQPCRSSGSVAGLPACRVGGGSALDAKTPEQAAAAVAEEELPTNEEQLQEDGQDNAEGERPRRRSRGQRRRSNRRERQNDANGNPIEGSENSDEGTEAASDESNVIAAAAAVAVSSAEQTAPTA